VLSHVEIVISGGISKIGKRPGGQGSDARRAATRGEGQLSLQRRENINVAVVGADVSPEIVIVKGSADSAGQHKR